MKVKDMIESLQKTDGEKEVLVYNDGYPYPVSEVDEPPHNERVYILCQQERI